MGTCQLLRKCGLQGLAKIVKTIQGAGDRGAYAFNAIFARYDASAIRHLSVPASNTLRLLRWKKREAKQNKDEEPAPEARR